MTDFEGASPRLPQARLVLTPAANGNGTKPYAASGIPAPPTKISMDRAVVDAVRMVQAAMQETGEQWSDEARQDLVSTV
jgi:hypothetical protein